MTDKQTKANTTTQSLPVMQPGGDQKAEQKTTAGNYFVANYPPFSFWTPQRVNEAQAALDSPPGDDTTLGVYVHIPFCRKRCHFCYFRVYTDKNAKEIQRYMDAVIAEANRYAQRAFVGGRKAKFVYFGGGTPSYLSAEQLQYLTDGLKKAFPWDEAEEVAFECEPGTLNEKKLKALVDIGITRLSLGIENFDDQILELNNRAHRQDAVMKAYNTAREVGFPQINIDLIAGMLGETEDNWQECVQQAIDMKPDCITIYQMEIPYNTTIYKQMRESGKSVAPVADWPTKRRWVSEAFGELEKAGYTIGSAYTAIKDPDNTKFLYRDALWTGADMLGLGVSSFSHVNATHFQNQHNYDPYLEAVEAGDLPIYRALKIDDEERLVREFVLQLKLGSVRLDRFREKFGVEVTQHFSDHLNTLTGDGVINIDNDRITFTRQGLLEVDKHLHGFFLPQHRDARYA